MELNELHVRNHRAGPPGHRHSVAGRDRGIRRVKINLSAPAGGEEEAIGPDRFHLAGNFIQNVNAQTMIFSRETEFPGGDQIDRHVIFEQLYVRRLLHRPREALSRSHNQ